MPTTSTEARQIGGTTFDQRALDALRLPGPVCLPNSDRVRDPIAGTMRSYKPSTSASPRRGSAQSTTAVTHQGSMFETTGPTRSYYVIYPDWSSESQSMRRLNVRNRGYAQWDTRPSVQPLLELLAPLADNKPQSRDELRRSAQAVHQRGEPALREHQYKHWSNNLLQAEGRTSRIQRLNSGIPRHSRTGGPNPGSRSNDYSTVYQHTYHGTTDRSCFVPL